MIGEEEILVAGCMIENEAREIYTVRGGSPGVINVTKCQPVRFRNIVVQPRQPLRSCIGGRQTQRRRRKLHGSPGRTIGGISPELQWKRVRRAAQVAQKT